jgi:mxaJ protein
VKLSPKMIYALTALLSLAALTFCIFWSARLSARPSAGAAAAPAALGISTPQRSRQLRVCADPNNLPFSNQKEEGFENQLAVLLARELGAELSYVWWPERRGFLRNTLLARRCDVVMGLPAGSERVLTSEPVYRSTYALVLGRRAPRLDSLEAPELRSLKIGVPLVGDDGANPAPVTVLARRKLTGNLRGYSVYGDYREDAPSAAIVRAVEQGTVDVAVAWGPLAGYFAAKCSPPLRVVPLREGADPGLPFAFDISIAVRKDEAPLLSEINAVLEQRRSRIRRLLKSFDFAGI